MINLVLAAIVVAVPIYMTVSIAHAYMNASGSVWQRLVASCKMSATVAWARLNALSFTLVTCIGDIAGYAGAPGVKDAIAPFLGPEYLTAYLLFVLIGSEIARRRTLAS